MSLLSRLSTKTWLVLIALMFLLARVGPLYRLDRTEFSKEKRTQDPFSRSVGVSSLADRSTANEASGGASDQGATLRVPAEHLASYLMANLMGGLKQVATISLWVKYGRLKDQQRYDEAVALLQILQVLQPERERVWSYLAWDIAFPISNRQPTMKQQWGKVKKATQILRDGNKRMGGSVLLHQELGWIYGFRVPQEPYMMNQTWNERGRTNYRIAIEHLKKARRVAKQRDQLQEYLEKYAFIMNYTLYDIVMLLHFGEHQTARSRIGEYQKLVQDLISDFQERDRFVPGPYRVRRSSFEDLPGVIEVDRKLHEIPWDTRDQRKKNRTEKINRTKKFLTAWKQFFHSHQGALAEEAARHVLRQSFELLYYVTRDLERFYRTGQQKFHDRAATLLREELFPLVENLSPEGSNVGGGYIRKARRELGRFWKQMNRNFEKQRALARSDNKQEKEKIRRQLENVYTDLLTLYHSNHRGFHMPWFKDEIDKLESEELLNY